MKEIKLNHDGTLNILDPEKYYVIAIQRIYQHDHVTKYLYWELVHVKPNYYGFFNITNNNKFESDTQSISIWASNDLQSACDHFLRTMHYLRSCPDKLYQFNSKKEFLKYIEIVF